MHNVLHCFLLSLKLECLSDEHKNLIKVVKKEIEGFNEGSIKNYVMNNGNMMNYSFGMVALVLFLLL